MATTVNNTTSNSRITIIFDAGLNPENEDNGPRLGTGDTESDVMIDNKVYHNIRSHTEIDANVHALQWNSTTNTGVLEYVDNRENETLSSFPQWATNVIIRCEAHDIWKTIYDSNIEEQVTAFLNSGGVYDDFAANLAQATNLADPERDNYLSAHGITY